MPKKTTRPPDPRALARALVENRFANLEDWEILSRPERRSWEPEGDMLFALVDAVIATKPGLAESREKLIALAGEIEMGRPVDPKALGGATVMDVVFPLAEANAEAGFLVGLELGRRLGGGR